ncbi:MAG: pilus assembly protein [Gemmataceae bacterium]|nr:pilus assembly protein [Gemmataceae bacterium]
MIRRRSRKRQGTTAVETAVVAIIFFMLMFSIFEYARFIYTQQLIFQAAREGARYAVVNTNSTSLVADTQAIVKTKMCGMDKNTSYYNCSVFMADSASKNLGDPTDAGFGVYICVQVDYDYSPIVPNLLFLNSKFRLTTKELMYSEAN